MTVTAVEELSRTRSRICLEDGTCFVLYKGEQRRFEIKAGGELGEAAWTEIMTEILPKRAALRCMNLLKSRAYTENQLRRKLAQGGYPQHCVNSALDYVKSYGYVDDRSYAEDYIAFQQDKKSRRRMEEDLMKKGIARETIREALLAREEAGDGPDEEKLARQWIEKKHYDIEGADYRERQKMAAFLYRKGISAGITRKVLDCADCGEYL